MANCSFQLEFEHLDQNDSTRLSMKTSLIMQIGAACALLHWSSASACHQDLNGDQIVGVPDVLRLLQAWGDCTNPCPEDLNQSMAVDLADLTQLLQHWGPCPSQHGIPIFQMDFEHQPVGLYTEDMLEMDWNAPSWSQGVEDGRVHIVQTDHGSHALAVDYPEATYGTTATGAQWKLMFDQSYDCLRVSYRLKFETPFDFVKGGKLPGLIGGQGNTGGGAPDGTDGWSGRMMWRADGAAVQYVYHPDQPEHYGQDFPWTVGIDPAHFIPGHWQEVVHEIEMNSPGQHNGRITCWLDGQLAMSETQMRFRDVETFAIDGFYFSTFFGGSNDSWSTTKDERIIFDDFIITQCE